MPACITNLWKRIQFGKYFGHLLVLCNSSHLTHHQHRAAFSMLAPCFTLLGDEGGMQSATADTSAQVLRSKWTVTCPNPNISHTHSLCAGFKPCDLPCTEAVSTAECDQPVQQVQPLSWCWHQVTQVSCLVCCIAVLAFTIKLPLHGSRGWRGHSFATR